MEVDLGDCGTDNFILVVKEINEVFSKESRYPQFLC